MPLIMLCVRSRSPEFANAEFNAQAKDATVEQAADWVLNLVERWR